MTTAISLEGMEFYARHGCFAEERAIGARFVVDVSIDADVAAGAQADSIEQTIDYSAVYQQVRVEMEQPSHLIENVALRIAQKIMEQFGQAQSVSVKVAKLNPALGGQVRQSAARVVLQR